MSTPPQFPWADRLKFPGMLPAEVIVFKAWLALHENEYTNWQFNVHIGAGVDPGPSVPAFWRDLAIKSTQLRIDAVGYQGNVPTLFEVKRRATPANIGQLTTYYFVWVQDNPQGPPPNLVLVFNTFQQNILPVAAASGIQLAQVDADFSALRITTKGRKGGVNPPTNGGQ
jgi:hypothetical protein